MLLNREILQISTPRQSIEELQNIMSREAAKKIIVCGGNGFLGSRICKYAVARGWDVTSIR